MNKFINYEKIWREIVGGVVFVERVEQYEELLAFCESKGYLNNYKDSFAEYDYAHIQKVISDIKAGKSKTYDQIGLPIEIHSIEKLKVLEEQFYLVLKPNKLFSIVIGKDINQILEVERPSLEKESIKIRENLQMHINVFEERYNFTVISKKSLAKIYDVNSTAVFTLYKQGDEYGDIGSIDFEDTLYIIHNMRFFLGAGTLTLS